MDIQREMTNGETLRIVSRDDLADAYVSLKVADLGTLADGEAPLRRLAEANYFGLELGGMAFALPAEGDALYLTDRQPKVMFEDEESLEEYVEHVETALADATKIVFALEMEADDGGEQ